jgi:hypothetical protein
MSSPNCLGRTYRPAEATRFHRLPTRILAPFCWLPVFLSLQPKPEPIHKPIHGDLAISSTFHQVCGFRQLYQFDCLTLHLERGKPLPHLEYVLLLERNESHGSMHRAEVKARGSLNPETEPS